MRLGVQATLDAEDHLIRVGGILFEIPFQEHQAVVLGWPVELAAVPAVAWRRRNKILANPAKRKTERFRSRTSTLESRAHGLKGLLLRARRRSPGESHEAEANRTYFFVD